MRHRTLALLLILVAATIGPFHPRAFGGPVKPIIVLQPAGLPPPDFFKRVKFVCGDLTPALAGSHFTAINILNPYDVPVDVTKEIIRDQPEPASGGVATSLGIPPIPFKMLPLAAIEIDCPEISNLLKVQNEKGYVLIQAPCLVAAGPDPSTLQYTCFDLVVDTVYEDTFPAPLINKVLFKLSSTVSPQLPGNKSLEILIPAPPLQTPLDLEAKLHQILGIPKAIKIQIVQVSVAPLGASLGLEVKSTTTPRLHP